MRAGQRLPRRLCAFLRAGTGPGQHRTARTALDAPGDARTPRAGIRLGKGTPDACRPVSGRVLSRHVEETGRPRGAGRATAVLQLDQGGGHGTRAAGDGAPAREAAPAGVRPGGRRGEGDPLLPCRSTPALRSCRDCARATAAGAGVRPPPPPGRRAAGLGLRQGGARKVQVPAARGRDVKALPLRIPSHGLRNAPASAGARTAPGRQRAIPAAGARRLARSAASAPSTSTTTPPGAWAAQAWKGAQPISRSQTPDAHSRARTA